MCSQTERQHFLYFKSGLLNYRWVCEHHKLRLCDAPIIQLYFKLHIALSNPKQLGLKFSRAAVCLRWNYWKISVEMSFIISETNAKGKCLVLFWESLGGWVFFIILLFLRSDILIFILALKQGFSIWWEEVGFCQWMYFLPFSCKFGQIVSLRKITVSTRSLEYLLFIYNFKLIFLILSLLSIVPHFLCVECWPGSRSLRAVGCSESRDWEKPFSNGIVLRCQSNNEIWAQELQVGSVCKQVW